jgi:hypothetical protein
MVPVENTPRITDLLVDPPNPHIYPSSLLITDLVVGSQAIVSIEVPKPLPLDRSAKPELDKRASGFFSGFGFFGGDDEDEFGHLPLDGQTPSDSGAARAPAPAAAASSSSTLSPSGAASKALDTYGLSNHDDDDDDPTLRKMSPSLSKPLIDADHSSSSSSSTYSSTSAATNLPLLSSSSTTTTSSFSSSVEKDTAPMIASSSSFSEDDVNGGSAISLQSTGPRSVPTAAPASVDASSSSQVSSVKSVKFDSNDRPNSLSHAPSTKRTSTLGPIDLSNPDNLVPFLDFAPQVCSAISITISFHMVFHVHVFC